MNSVTRLRHGVTWPLSALLALTLNSVSAQPAHVHLPAPAKGDRAITALAEHLPAVAKAYGLQPGTLVELFQSQPSLAVDQEGALLFLCDGLSVAKKTSSAPAVIGAAETVSAGMAVDSSVRAIAFGATLDAFKLHSLSGATKVIYLDFTGHTTSGTPWNSSFGSGSPIVSGAYDSDGDPSTFSAAERGVIQRIWQRVAEDYAPFNVDVTTEDPGVEALRRTSSGDTAYGIRVVISPTNWYNTNAGGVAYIGSFNAGTDTPCFAFTQQLANGEKYIAEAAAHEVGHTLGLYHDGRSGTAPTEYYEGQGNWAPIMGVGYYKPLVQFSKGEYAGANNLQDDLAIIAGYVPLAGDDHGNTLASATVLATPSIADGGTIETRTDVDVFRFDCGAGAISLSIKGPAPDTDLDLKVELIDVAGQVLQSSDSSSTVAASISTTVAASTYFLRVSGVGLGDPLTTGYSSYGSIGNYIITGTVPSPGTKQPPVAIISPSTLSGTAPLTITFSGQSSSDSDGLIASYQWNFGNGTGATGIAAGNTYMSAGTYTVTLTVIDNDGLSGMATATITVAAAPNIDPVAVASSDRSSGTAPVTVAFSSAGSTDSDGTIVSYAWDFGDGTSSSLASPAKTYTAAGTYTVRLTVTDNRDATASATLPIAVLPDHAFDVDVNSFLLGSTASKAGSTSTATIVIFDRQGRPAAGTTVSLQWSGLVSGSTSGKTDANGKVVLTSSRTKKVGTQTATITAVVPSAGNSFDATIFSAPMVQSIAIK
ncbi:MAG: PKD domain-containing protein [Opitutus sp.]